MFRSAFGWNPDTSQQNRKPLKLLQLSSDVIASSYYGNLKKVRKGTNSISASNPNFELILASQEHKTQFDNFLFGFEFLFSTTQIFLIDSSQQTALDSCPQTYLI